MTYSLDTYKNPVPPRICQDLQDMALSKLKMMIFFVTHTLCRPRALVGLGQEREKKRYIYVTTIIITVKIKLEKAPDYSRAYVIT